MALRDTNPLRRPRLTDKQQMDAAMEKLKAARQPRSRPNPMKAGGESPGAAGWIRNVG